MDFDYHEPGYYIVIQKSDPDPRVFVFRVKAEDGARTELGAFQTWKTAELYCRELEREATPRAQKVKSALRRFFRL